MSDETVYGPTLPDEVAGPAKTLKIGRPDRTGWLLLVAIAAGDFLLWGYFPSVALALFLAGLVVLQLASSWRRQSMQSLARIGLLTLVGVTPLIETINFLTVVIALGATFAACFFASHQLPESWAARAEHYLVASILSFIRLPQFVIWFLYSSGDGSWKSKVMQWTLPIVFAGVFVGLFASANPIWEQWLTAIDTEALLNAIFSARSMFWLALAWFVLPFIQRAQPLRRFFQWSLRSEEAKATQAKTDHVPLIQRCLILVNIVFALQTGLDATYLWAGAELPDGMTYAEYAHRGAYPLVAATLLAGAFVLVTMRPGGAGEKSSVVKWLVLLWVAQNLLLLGASIERLLLYVAQYSLTYWRLAAFIWMALVAVGLGLIIIRFITGKSSAWLLGANGAMLGATLYATAPVNFPHVIASYNLAQYVPEKSNLDFRYLRGLGPLALPALMDFKEENPDDMIYLPYNIEREFRRKIEYQVGTNWRSWSFRGQRLAWFVERRTNATKVPEQRKLSETYTP